MTFKKRRNEDVRNGCCFALYGMPRQAFVRSWKKSCIVPFSECSSELFISLRKTSAPDGLSSSLAGSSLRAFKSVGQMQQLLRCTPGGSKGRTLVGIGSWWSARCVLCTVCPPMNQSRNDEELDGHPHLPRVED